MSKNVPFHPNKSDNLHCLQVSIQSILDSYQIKYKIDEIDRNTGFFGGFSWTPHAVNWLNIKGLNTKLISPFDYGRLVLEGEDYLKEFKVNGIYEIEKKGGQYEHLDEVRKAAKEMISNNLWENRKLEVGELEIFLDEYTHLAIAKTTTADLSGNFNVPAVSHFVTVIEQYKLGQWLIHDPGLPPKERRKVNQRNSLPGGILKDVFGGDIILCSSQPINIL